jgi:hypothetical protein
MSLFNSRAGQSSKRRLEATASSSVSQIKAEDPQLKSATSTACPNSAFKLSEPEINDKAIYRHEIEFDALHKRLCAAEREVGATAAREAERAVSEREFELRKLSSAP